MRELWYDAQNLNWSHRNKKAASQMGEAIGDTMKSELAARSDKGLTATASSLNWHYYQTYTDVLAKQFYRTRAEDALDWKSVCGKLRYDCCVEVD